MEKSPTTSTARNTAKSVANVRILVCYGILCHIALGGSRVAMSLGGLELKASPLAIGIILSFYNLLPMTLSLSAGRWIDRMGVAKPTLYGAILLCVGTALPCLLWDLGVLYLSAVMIGAGFMGLHLAVQKAVGDLASDHIDASLSAEVQEQTRDRNRALNFSMIAIGFSISGFLGPMIAGFTIDHAGYRTAFGVMAVGVFIAVMGYRKFPFAGPSKTFVDETKHSQGTDSSKNFFDLISTPELKRLYAAVVVLSAAWDVLQFIIPIYGKSLGFSASQIGIILGAFSIGSFIVRLAMPWLSKMFSEWTLILASIITSIVVYALYPFFPTMAAMVALAILLGLGLGCSQPMILSVIHRSAPEGRVGEAVGLRMTIIGASQAALPISFGAVGAAVGLGSLFWGMALFALAGAIYVGRGVSLRSRAALKPGDAEKENWL